MQSYEQFCLIENSAAGMLHLQGGMGTSTRIRRKNHGLQALLIKGRSLFCIIVTADNTLNTCSPLLNYSPSGKNTQRMGKSIRIAIAEDHALFREGLASLLKEEEGITLVFEASNGEELLDKLKTNKVDVILLDLEMPILSGKQTLKHLNTKFPSVRPIVLSMFEADKYISQAIKLGARGYLAKNCSIEKVVDAIYAVHEQGYYFDDEVSKVQLFKLVSDGRVEPKFTDEDLSSRELAVLELICNEKKNNEIADKLCISVRTVEVHRQNLLRKTNAKNVAGLVVYAIKKGYFEV